MVAAIAQQNSEARIFNVTSQTANAERLSGSRIFSVYNIPAQAQRIAQARIYAIDNYRGPQQISQARVLAVVSGRVADPLVRAWTFTLDGHDFYVLRLGDETTLLYDVYAEQWVEWTSKDLLFWRLRTGFSWAGAQSLADTYGSTIVAGDDTFGLLWFLDPDQPYDEHPNADNNIQQLDFERIVTGQVIASGRAQIPCYVIFVDGDNFGLTGTEFTPGVTLEYSDDQGRNFVQAETLPSLADPSENNPYAWYSLGQISSPGRIFRVRDNGVLARIDSMDMNDDAG